MEPGRSQSMLCQVTLGAEQGVPYQKCRRPVEVEVCAWLAQPSCCKGDGTGRADISCGTGGHIHHHNAAGDVSSCGVERHSTAFLLCTVCVSMKEGDVQMRHPGLYNLCQHRCMSRQYVLTDMSRSRFEGQSGVQEGVEGSHLTTAEIVEGGARVCARRCWNAADHVALRRTHWEPANSLPFPPVTMQENCNFAVAGCTSEYTFASQASLKGSLTVALFAVVQGTRGTPAATP